MDNFLDKFNNTTRELIGDLRAVYPSLNESLDQFLEKYPCTDNTYMIYFIENIGKYGDLVAEKNNELFNKIELLKGVEIKFIFVEPESAPNRPIIWKYIEAMYLYSLTYMKLNSEGGDTMEEEVRKYMETIGFNSENFNKILQNLQQSAEQPAADQPSFTGTPSDNIPPEMEKMADTLFGGMIGNLAKEIASELKTDDLETSNPQELLQNLFSPEKGNLMNLVQNISGKLQTKLDNGQLDQQALFNEATSIMNNLQNMPGMENMMKNMAGSAGSGMPGFDPSMMANLMSGLMGGAKKDNSKNLSLLPKNHPKRRRK